MINIKYYVAVFRSRSQTVKFFDTVRSYGISARVINTPRELSVGCGLSVLFKEKDLKMVEMVRSRLQLSSFVGIFPVA